MADERSHVDIIKTDSRFLHGEDLKRDGKWCEFALTIKAVGDENSMKTEQGQVIPGWPVTFNETEKTAVLKGSNLRLAIAALKTNARSKWIGRRLTVYPVVGDWFGQRDVCAVRVRVPEGIPRPYIKPHILGKDLTK